ncbi:MAG: 16S rRNA (guanine(527)-N(7))-methyltransferase RsmG [Alicyclobacillus sp.]|nr:16S rRNA (guanine(527)-N(7))-methyltransferase RsmG [Alicyclobacillus sp.]
MDELGEWTEAERQRFDQYCDLLLQWNERMNLTAIVDRSEVYVKHFQDSLLVENLPEWRGIAETGGSAADVGTGAGFPGIPLAIRHPRVRFVLMDSLQKRLRFLSEVVEHLGLSNVELVHGRAEDLGRQPGYRHQFDVVLARAVARLSTLVELMSPFARAGGFVLAYKGPGVGEEAAEAGKAMRCLGVELVRVEEFELSGGLGHRAIAVMRQVRAAPGEYPRKAGIPQRSPLQG